MKDLSPVLFSLLVVLAVIPTAHACQYPNDACVTSFTITPNVIVGDQFQEAVAIGTIHIPSNANGTLIALELQIPTSLYITKAYCGGGTYGVTPDLGYTLSCGSRNLTGDVTIPITLVGYNYGTTIQTGTIYAEVEYFPEPRPTATLEVDPVTVSGETPDQDPDGPCPGCGYGGAPINFTNGNTWITQQDYAIPGLGGGLNITRTWNSQWPLKQPPETLGIFGHSWRSNLDERVQQVGNVVKYWKGDGSLLFYTWDSGTSSYVLTAPTNDATTLTYSSVTQQTTVTLKDGTQKIFNSNGYPTSVVDRNGNTTTITIDAANQNRIVSVTDPAGQTVTFSYTNAQFPRLCTSISDGTGTIASYQYDANGLLKQVAYADGSQLNFSYTDSNSSTLISSVTDSQGKVIESHTYDAQRRGLTSQQANGVNKVTVAYSVGVYKNENMVTDSLGNNTTVLVGTVAQRRYVISTTGPGCVSCGFNTNTSYSAMAKGYINAATDGNGKTIQYTYDAQGNVLSKLLPEGSPLVGNTGMDVWHYAYNSFGKPLTSTDPLNHTTTYQYDTHGNLTSITTPSPDGVVVPSVTTFLPNAQGQITQITDPLGNHTNLAYCPTGMSNCPYGMINSITDAQNNTTTYTYDARGNPTSLTDANNNVTQFQYDSGNRLTLVTYPTTPATTVQFHYDWRGRRDWVIDQNNNKTTYAYDDADRLVSVTDAQTPSPGVTLYVYDTESNITDIYDANSNHTHFDFFAGSGHQLKKTTFPSGYYESYTWDANDNLQKRTDRANQAINYYYDYQSRLVRKLYPDSSQVNYTFDATGRLTQVSDASGVYAFTYDNMNRLTVAGANYSFDSVGNYTVKYGYDAASNRKTMTDPQNLNTAYGYDTLNRLSTLAFNGQSPAFAFGYDALSRRTSLTRPNNVSTTYGYDAVSRLLSVLHKDAGGTVLDGATYTYDSAGNRLTRTDQHTSTTLTYGYDNIYQLLSAMQGATTTETYTYDKAGNRLSSLGVSPYTYNSSNELTSTPTLTYTYDNNGNTKTKSDGTTYTWDYENRLTKVVLPGSGGTVNFKYDPFGRRVQKSFTQGSTTTTTNYLYDGINVLEEVDNSGNVLAKYTQGANVDEPLAELRSGSTNYHEADGLGSITSLTGSSGTIASTYTYDSFGQLASSTGSIVNPFQYTARDFDAEMGLRYYRARYYDPQTGRFINEDPARSSSNFYSYVHNSPITRTDPFGLWDTYTHSALYWNALRACMDKKDIWLIQKFSLMLDENTQMPWMAFVHSMKAPWQSDAEGLQAIANWTNTTISTATTAYQAGDSSWLTFFGEALHTITDSSSPAHMQNGKPIGWPTYPNALQHGNEKNSIETWANMTPELMQQNINMIRKAYEQVTGKKCGCEQ